MGLTALRNRRGIQAKPAVEAPGRQSPDQQTTQEANANSGAGLEGLAPRYQQMIRAGVDPDVVAKRAAAFKAGQLPGQVNPSGQTPGIVPGAPGGGPIAKPAQRPNGRFPVNPGGGGPRPLPAVEPPIPAPGGPMESMSGGPLLGGPRLPNGQPMQNITAPEPAQGGLTPLPAFTGGFLSPSAWGALSGAMLPNGQPMGGAGNIADALQAYQAARGAGVGFSYGNDAQARPIPPPAAPPVSTNPADLAQAQAQQQQLRLRMQTGGAGGPTPFIPNEPSQGGASGPQSMNGGGFQSGPLLPNGRPMAPTGQPPVSVDPQQARNAAVARGLARRMGGGALNV